MTTADGRPIPWDIYEEHLDEAGWLWGAWERAMDSAIHTLGDVIDGPEERLAAHLDGLVLGGRRVAERLLLPALEGDDANLSAAAAWALVQGEDADHQDAVVDALVAAPPPARLAMARALVLSPRIDISRVARLWHVGPPALRPMILGIFGRREPDWVRAQVEAAFRDGEPTLVAAAWRAVRTVPDPQALSYLDESLRSAEPAVRAEALITGVALGSRAAWEACREAAMAADDGCRVPLALLAVSPHAQDRGRVRARVDEPSIRAHALWALGFAGEVEDGDRLVEMIGDPQAAPVAGEALSTMTGIAIDGPFVVRAETRGPQGDEVGDDDPPPVVRQEDHLPVPDAAKVTAWWRSQRRQFRPGVRHLGGQARTPTGVLAALSTAATWRRQILWLELVGLKRAPAALDLRDWARQQQSALAEGVRRA
ncbi:MAG TPA: TIGR02270 family protein [Polyangia bacterium]|nr:TIGR02270 family protein [Polyangia bacterium]